MTDCLSVRDKMSKCELIELKDLSLNDRIELAAPPPPAQPHPPPPPTAAAAATATAAACLSQVVRLLGESVTIEGPSGGAGEAGGAGHDFQPSSHTHLTWCDLCGDFIWGLYKQGLRCTNCRYTCHYRCRPFIQLDCSTDCCLLTSQLDFSEDTVETNVDEQVDWGKQELTFGEIQQKVKEYNAQTNSSLYMVINKDGSYTGFIRVQFKLSRPISLPPPQKLSSTQEGGGPDGRLKRRTSFYLPRDTAKHLHISSRTWAREVIEALLNKFTVVDNPAKFALYERTERSNQVYLRKLSDDERPLHLRLCAGPNEKVLSLVLKENETGEVNWDAFSFPELRNFLRILQREEEEHVRQIVRRYAIARDKMKQAMASVTKPG